MNNILRISEIASQRPGFLHSGILEGLIGLNGKDINDILDGIEKGKEEGEIMGQINNLRDQKQILPNEKDFGEIIEPDFIGTCLELMAGLTRDQILYILDVMKDGEEEGKILGIIEELKIKKDSLLSTENGEEELDYKGEIFRLFEDGRNITIEDAISSFKTIYFKYKDSFELKNLNYFIYPLGKNFFGNFDSYSDEILDLFSFILKEKEIMFSNPTNSSIANFLYNLQSVKGIFIPREILIYVAELIESSDIESEGKELAKCFFGLKRLEDDTIPRELIDILIIKAEICEFEGNEILKSLCGFRNFTQKTVSKRLLRSFGEKLKQSKNIFEQSNVLSAISGLRNLTNSSPQNLIEALSEKLKSSSGFFNFAILKVTLKTLIGFDFIPDLLIDAIIYKLKVSNVEFIDSKQKNEIKRNIRSLKINEDRHDELISVIMENEFFDFMELAQNG